MLQIGDLAPDFTGRIGENDGDVIRLSDYIGQRVVLYFFPYINSYGCTTEACSFRDKWEVIQEEEIVVIGVSANSVKSQRKFAMKHHLPFPLGRTLTGKYQNSMVHAAKTGSTEKPIWGQSEGHS